MGTLFRLDIKAFFRVNIDFLDTPGTDNLNSLLGLNKRSFYKNIFSSLLGGNVMDIDSNSQLIRSYFFIM